MAQYAQMTREGGFTDLVCYSASAIPAGYCVLFTTVSGQERAVALPTNSGGFARLAGVTTSAIPAGGYGTVCVHGPAIVYAHSVLATGDWAQVYDATSHLGEVQAALTGSNQEALPLLGRVITANAADGDPCQVFVSVAPITTAA